MTKLLHIVMSVVHLVSCCTKNSSSSKPVALFIQVCLSRKMSDTSLQQHINIMYCAESGNTSRATVVDKRRTVVFMQLKVEHV